MLTDRVEIKFYEAMSMMRRWRRLLKKGRNQQTLGKA